MYFDSWQALWLMDGHGGFVWSAYAIGFSVLALLVWLPVARHRRLRREILDTPSRQQ